VIRIYVYGADFLLQLGRSDILGLGGPLEFTAAGSAEWLDLCELRGQTGTANTEFAPLAGIIIFDAVNADWFLGTGAIGTTQQDLRSVAMHEIGHVLGFGTALSWYNKVSDDLATFGGTAARAVHGAAVPMEDIPDDAALTWLPSHWQQGLVHERVDTGAEQVDLMGPVSTAGERHVLTNLDLAGFDDTGWETANEIVTPPPNNVGIGDATLTVESRKGGDDCMPGAGIAGLVLFGSFTVLSLRRRRV
jgi:hypothetical protein